MKYLIFFFSLGVYTTLFSVGPEDGSGKRRASKVVKPGSVLYSDSEEESEKDAYSPKREKKENRVPHAGREPERVKKMIPYFAPKKHGPNFVLRGVDQKRGSKKIISARIRRYDDGSKSVKFYHSDAQTSEKMKPNEPASFFARSKGGANKGGNLGLGKRAVGFSDNKEGTSFQESDNDDDDDDEDEADEADEEWLSSSDENSDDDADEEWFPRQPRRNKTVLQRRQGSTATTHSNPVTSSSSSNFSTATAHSNSSLSAVPTGPPLENEEDSFKFQREMGRTKGNQRMQDPMYSKLSSRVQALRKSIRNAEEKGDPNGKLPELKGRLGDALEKREAYVERRKCQRIASQSQHPDAVRARNWCRKASPRKVNLLRFFPGARRNINDKLKTLKTQIELYEKAPDSLKPASVVKRVSELLNLLSAGKKKFEAKWKGYKDTYGVEIKGYSSDYAGLVARGEAVLKDWEEKHPWK